MKHASWVVVLLAAGCVVAPPAPKPGTSEVAVAKASPAAAAAKAPAAAGALALQLKGVVRAPAGIVANNGGGIVANNGARVGAPAFRLAAVEQAPLAGARVYVADAAGLPLAGIPAVMTDERGGFQLAGKLPPLALMIAVEARNAAGQAVVLRTLARGDAAEADVDGLTTMVTEALLDGAPAQVGAVDAAAFSAAVAKTGAALDKFPDFADRVGIRTRMRELAEQVAELKASLDGMKAELAQVQTKVADLRAEIERAKERTAGAIGASATPSPLPTGRPTTQIGNDGSTPPAGDLQTPTPSPSPTPTPVPSASPSNNTQPTPTGAPSTEASAEVPASEP